MTALRRIALNVVVIAGVALLVLTALLARVLINPDRYQPQLISYLEENSGKTTEINRLTVTFFPVVTIHVYGIGVKSPPPFPPGYVVKVAQADATIDPWSLLRGSFAIRSLRLQGVEINLLSAPDGRWNFENPQAMGFKNTFPLGVINSVVIEGAQLVLSNLLPSGAVGPAFAEAHDVTSELRIVNLAAIVNPSTPSLNGQGSWRAGRMRLGAVETTDLSATLRLESSTVSIANVKASAYSGTITGVFSLSLATTNASVVADARLSEINLASLLKAFHEQRTSQTGKLDGELNLGGEVQHTANPLSGLHGTGRVRITSGQVPSLMSNASFGKLASFNDLGPAPSAFVSISADLQLADLWVSSRLVDVDGFGLDVDGSGRVSVSGSDAMDYTGVATITTKQGFWTNLFARMGGAIVKDGKLTFPFRLGGTIEHPTVTRAPGGK